MLDSKQLGDMPPLTHVYIMENVSTDLALDELEDRVMKETWFVKEGFDRRSGLGFTAGSLLGVTTALATVADKWGTEVGESASVAKAQQLIPLLPKQGAPYSTQLVFDSEEAVTMSNVFLRHLTPPETREIYTDGSELRDDKRQLYVRVSDSLAAIARGYEAADTDSSHGGCFYCSDFFGLPKEQLDEFVRDPSTLTHFRTQIARREPVNMMQRAVEAASAKLALVLPICGLSLVEIRSLLPTILKTFPSRVLVIVHGVGKGWGGSGEYLCHKMIAAITRCGEGRPPRRALVACASGGGGNLTQMGFCAKHGLPLIVLDGSGRLSDLWASIWHERASSRFDPVLQQQRLSRAFCYTADEAAVEQLHIVLSRGELVIHPVANSGVVLERLCLQQLLGDPLLANAEERRMSYERASARYEMPRMLLTNLSICLALVTTILATLVAEDDRASAGYFLCVIFPAVLMVVDQIDVYLGASVAARAVERARGLIERQAFMYRTRVAGYSDAVIARHLKEAAASGVASGAAELTDVETQRQQLFTRRLDAIEEAAGAAGAFVHAPVEGRGGTGAVYPTDAMRSRRGSLAALSRAGGDAIDGDEYIAQRVDPHVKRSAAAARRLLVFCLVARLGLFVAAAVGTALATLGLTKYVAVTVAVSTALTRWLNTTRVEARRSAHARAASALNSAKLAWTALPREMRSRQAERDRLVLRVESVLEQTLPPAS